MRRRKLIPAALLISIFLVIFSFCLSVYKNGIPTFNDIYLTIIISGIISAIIVTIFRKRLFANISGSRLMICFGYLVFFLLCLSWGLVMAMWYGWLTI